MPAIKPKSAELLHPDTFRYNPLGTELISAGQYPVLSIISHDSLVNIATWIMLYGTPQQKDMVRGTMDMAFS